MTRMKGFYYIGTKGQLPIRQLPSTLVTGLLGLLPGGPDPCRTASNRAQRSFPRMF